MALGIIFVLLAGFVTGAVVDQTNGKVHEVVKENIVDKVD